MCDNILELAGNPFTISPTEELHPDPTYDVNANLPWWIRSCRWVQKVLYDIAVWYNGIPWTVKLFTGIGLLAIALVLTLATGGGGMGVLSVLLQVAIGVGVGVGLYTIGSLLTGTFTWEGFANAALDAFLVTSAIVFVSASVNAIKYACRTKKLQEYSSEFLEWLNKGEANNTVYKGIDKYGDEIYTGITKQKVSKRLYQHRRAGKSFEDLKVIYNGLTRNQARSIETYKILTDGASHLNKILSVGKQHRFFNEAMLWAKTFIGG